MILIPDVKFLQHKFEIENKDGSKDTVTSTLCEYGSPVGSGGYSAMSKLVGIPCGVGKCSVLPQSFAVRVPVRTAEAALLGRVFHDGLHSGIKYQSLVIPNKIC